MLLEYSARHSDVRLEVTVSNHFVDLVEEGFDLAVRVGALPDSSNLVARRLTETTVGMSADDERRRQVPSFVHIRALKPS